MGKQFAPSKSDDDPFIRATTSKDELADTLAALTQLRLMPCRYAHHHLFEDFGFEIAFSVAAHGLACLHLVKNMAICSQLPSYLTAGQNQQQTTPRVQRNHC